VRDAGERAETDVFANKEAYKIYITTKPLRPI
jgi:hypothetical protein